MVAKIAGAIALVAIATGAGIYYLAVRSTQPAPAVVKKAQPQPAAKQKSVTAKPEENLSTGSAKSKKSVQKEALIHLSDIKDTQKAAPKKRVAPKSVQKKSVRKKATNTRAATHKRVKKSSEKEPMITLPEKSVQKPAPVLLQVRDVTDVAALEKQFEKSPRYATALKIGKLYYDQKRYEKASEWARKANLIDRDDEAAWILYAKSEYALGHKERAKRILKLFLEYKDSIRARTLLISWSKE
jgi:tetratricopeptide (TPR) repeat protein